ncbi:MAG: A/G-specific adenine glycosylase, partial [Gemmatimonadetes bacterium]|nr:A/G-specific adenine glycosylase [Gemmatimonadota bacterium]
YLPAALPAIGAVFVNKPDSHWSESPEEVASFRAALLDFYDRHGRALPWRESNDPYAILVSEIMAQQTRVETVVSYYERWLERFPTFAALAAAPEDDVLKEWEGLGYYSRARNLHRAAKVVRERHGGRLPESALELRDLPGVGPYTAGAVASIAFDRAEPAVDGNVRRVYARLFDEASPIPREVERWAARVVDPARPGDFNQALMELGATVCTPRRPSCERCPVASWCRALEEGTAELRPSPRRRSPVRQEVRAVAVLVRRGRGGAPPTGRATKESGRRIRGGERREIAGERREAVGDRFLVRRRPAEGLLAGMWDFPSISAEEGDTDARIVERVRELARRRGLGADGGRVLSPVPHQFSHLRVEYRAVLLEVASPPAGAQAQAPTEGETEAAANAATAHADAATAAAAEAARERAEAHAPPSATDEAERWVGVADLDRLALPVAQQKIFRLALDAWRGSVD